MKIQDKETFDKANVFGLGQENSATNFRPPRW